MVRSKSIEMIEDPVKIAAAQQEIVEIQALPGLRPRMAMKMNLAVVGMTMVGYEGGGQTSMLLMQMQVAGQSDEQLQQNFRQQGGKNQKNFQVESSETRKIKVDGTERDFLFAKGKILQSRVTASRQTGDWDVPFASGNGFSDRHSRRRIV